MILRLKRAMRKPSFIIILICLVILVFPFAGYAGQLTGKVVKIHTGDTIEILGDGGPIRIHLYGIHCPERDQPLSKEAMQYTSDLAYGKVVTVHLTNTDRRSGKSGTVMLPGGKSLNSELVKAGLAWWNQQSAPDDRVLQALENSAKSNRFGLWLVPDPVPPWGNEKITVNDSAGQIRQNSPHQPYDDDTTVFITSTGEKYHRYGCRYLIKSMIPIRLGEARTSGLIPCPTCGPPK
jgi:micrococcal nuclease